MLQAICIDGPGGGGKSTFATALVEHIGVDPETQLIRTDWYFEKWPEASRDPNNPTTGFFNAERFMKEVGYPLMQGGKIAVREYVHTENGFDYVERPVPEDGLPVIVEGIKTIRLPINWLSKVWVDTPRGVRKQRFMGRRMDERRTKVSDAAVLERAFEHWADDAEAYEREIKPHTTDDIIVIDGTAPAKEQLAVYDEKYWHGPHMSVQHWTFEADSDNEPI